MAKPDKPYKQNTISISQNNSLKEGEPRAICIYRYFLFIFVFINMKLPIYIFIETNINL